MPAVTMRELLESGVHFGHQTRRWNPKMKPYVFGARNGIYIIDLQKTVDQTRAACAFATQVAFATLSPTQRAVVLPRSARKEKPPSQQRHGQW